MLNAIKRFSFSSRKENFRINLELVKIKFISNSTFDSGTSFSVSYEKNAKLISSSFKFLIDSDSLSFDEELMYFDATLHKDSSGKSMEKSCVLIIRQRKKQISQESFVIGKVNLNLHDISETVPTRLFLPIDNINGSLEIVITLNPLTSLTECPIAETTINTTVPSHIFPIFDSKITVASGDINVKINSLCAESTYSQPSTSTEQNQLATSPSEKSTSVINALNVEELIKASRSGRLAEVHSLLQFVPVDSVDGDGRTALYAASYTGQDEVIVVLLQRGAMVNFRLSNGNTALHAACFNNHESVAALLCHRGAEANAQDSQIQRTPLHIACSKNKESLALLLVEHGADVTIADKGGRFPLSLLSDQDVARRLKQASLEVLEQLAAPVIK